MMLTMITSHVDQTLAYKSADVVNRRERLHKMAVAGAEAYNASNGYRNELNCTFCKNKGNKMVVEAEGMDQLLMDCDCVSKRNIIKNFADSGLGGVLDIYRLDNFDAKDKWQQVFKARAINFINKPDGKWFYAGGMTGSGKTHLCSAIVGELMSSGKKAKYVLWRDESTRLKALLNTEEYTSETDKLKNADVLYIDDLFKTKNGDKVTGGDINLAFEILNKRYMTKKTTIISSESLEADLTKIDDAIAGRIFEMCGKEYLTFINKDALKNYRKR